MTDYAKLVKALRHLSTGRCEDSRKCELCAIYETCLPRCVLDAAAAIEALQAQLPKRGKWIGVSPMVDTVQCSICGGQLFSEELETPYCPYCGAKMEAQDG